MSTERSSKSCRYFDCRGCTRGMHEDFQRTTRVATPVRLTALAAEI